VTTKSAYLEASPQQKQVVLAHLFDVLALLRAQYLSYQTSHWQARGLPYYGNHLLFQRLYESVPDEIDGLAEKLVGYLGGEAVSLAPQAVKIANYAVEWAKIECPFHRGLASEKAAQAAFQVAYDHIKAAKAMTLGLDDFLMAAANAHETNAYLLQQVVSAPPARVASLVVRRFSAEVSQKPPAPVAPKANDQFYDNPRFYETHDFAQSGAISNEKDVVQGAAAELDLPLKSELAKIKDAPPTPGEILDEPGGEQFSTLHRLVVDTEDPDGKQASVRSTLAGWTFATPGMR